MSKILYKYFPLSCEEHFERLEKLLQGRVYFSFPTSFNDPFELNPVLKKPSLEMVRGFMEKAGVILSEAQIDRVAKSVIDRDLNGRVFVDSWIDGFGVLCLTPDYKNLLMWSHYASNHKGVCVGFDVSHAPFTGARPVKYEKNRPILLGRDFSGNINEIVVEKVFFTKSLHWEYECEWRCLKRAITDDERKYYLQSVRDGDLDEEDVVEVLSSEGGPGVYPFEPDAVRRVFLGAKADEKTVGRVVKMMDCMSRKPKAYKLDLDHAFYGLKLSCKV